MPSIEPTTSSTTTNSHTSELLQKAQKNLNLLWAKLPHSNPTRSTDNPLPDSAFNVPSGECIGVFDQSTQTWADPENIENIDTISSIGIAMTFKGGGFAILSVNENIPPLLYYSEDGSFDSTTLSKSNKPENGFTAYIDNLAKCIEIRTSADDEFSTGRRYQVDSIREIKIAGRGIPVRWGQGEPYNAMISDNFLIPAGCVATAVAQIMAFHQYPSVYKEYTFNWPGMLSFNLAHYYFDKKYDKSLPLLFYLLGKKENLEIKYSTNGSGTDSKKAIRTFKNFGYSEIGKQYHYKFDLVKSEIDKGYPVMISGKPKGQRKGHAWVADAYFILSFNIFDKNDYPTKIYENYIRCNWGWDGNFDGYALAGVFDPDETFTDPYRKNTGVEEVDCEVICGVESQSNLYEPYCTKNHIIIGIRK